MPRIDGNKDIVLVGPRAQLERLSTFVNDGNSGWNQRNLWCFVLDESVMVQCKYYLICLGPEIV